MARMISIDDARALIMRHVPRRSAVRTALGETYGRVLAEDITAMENLPAGDRSAVDGYAMRADDRSERFRIVAEIPAGKVWDGEIEVGQCARIFTGAALPRGATAVLMQEAARRDGDWMRGAAPERGASIRKRGEDACAGDLILAAGLRLRAPELALLAQLGSVAPLIYPAPRVVHVVTGGELIDPAEKPAAGQLRDSNSTLIAALLIEAGAELRGQSRCDDDLDLLIDAVDAGLKNACDFLLISGGASVGDFDFGARALKELGFAIHFDRLNLRPGKPLIFATRGEQSAFVIPGNPLAHLVCFQLLIRAALGAAEGGPGQLTLWTLPLFGRDRLPGNDRETWWPARLASEQGKIGVVPCRWKSSGDLTGLPGLDALVQIPAGSSGYAAGTLVPCLLLERRGG